MCPIIIKALGPFSETEGGGFHGFRRILQCAYYSLCNLKCSAIQDRQYTLLILIC